MPGRAFRSPATSGEYPAKPGEGGRNTFDPRLWAMSERRQFWEGHRVMNEEPYWHLDNPCHPHQIGQSHSFKLAVLPIRWVGTTAAPVRAVALLER